MAGKFPKPFFRSTRNCWYVQLGKQQVKLHADESEALKLYHGLMARRCRRVPSPREMAASFRRGAGPGLPGAVRQHDDRRVEAATRAGRVIPTRSHV